MSAATQSKDVVHDPVWREAFEAAEPGLCETCQKCEYSGRLRRRTFGAALVGRAPLRQSQRLLRKLEAHLRPHLGERIAPTLTVEVAPAGEPH